MRTFGVAAAYVFLGERLSLSQGVGAATILFSVLLLLIWALHHSQEEADREPGVNVAGERQQQQHRNYPGDADDDASDKTRSRDQSRRQGSRGKDGGRLTCRTQPESELHTP